MTEQLVSTQRMRQAFLAMIVGGLALSAVGLAIDPVRTWSNLLVGGFFLITLALGGAVFIAMTYVVGAAWHVAFRRIPEALATMLPVTGIVLLLILAGRFIVFGPDDQAYNWPAATDGNAGTFWFKELWLNPPFWISRAVAYIIVWSLLATAIVGSSRKQDSSGDLGLTTKNIRLSAVFLVVYALTFSLASCDWIMALEPLWFSTIWGVYQFSGMMQATLAVVIIAGLLLRRPGGPLHGIFTDDHLHDLGKLALAFSCFWMYIWFSQYMLIWYANIPEETTYFIARTNTAWGPIVVASIALNWVIPFLVLLPKASKRSSSVMARIACVVLVGRWIDLYTMVCPPTVGTTPKFGIWEVAAIVSLIGAVGILLSRAFAQAPAVPAKDPYLEESLHHHCL